MTTEKQVQLPPLARDFLQKRGLSDSAIAAFEKGMGDKAAQAVDSRVAFKEADTEAPEEDVKETVFTPEQSRQIGEAIEYFVDRAINKLRSEELEPTVEKLSDFVLQVAEEVSGITKGPIAELAQKIVESPQRSKQWLNNQPTKSDETLLDPENPDDVTLAMSFPTYAKDDKSDKDEGPTPFPAINEIIASANGLAGPSNQE